MMKRATVFIAIMGMISLSASAQDYKKIHQDLLVIDGHNDVIIESILPGRDIGKRLKTGHTDIPRLQEGGVDVQVFAVWSDDKKHVHDGFQHANDQIDALEKVVQDNQSKIEIAKNSDDLERIHKAGKIVALIGIEGGNMIEGNLDYLEQLYNRGARYLTLTWNYNLPWASAAAQEVKTKSKKGKGLSRLGEDIIKRMNQLGMMVDLSHAGEQTFYDVMRISTKPVLVSHSNAASLTPHYRNLNDKQLRALKENGGVIGVNFYSEFLDKNFKSKVTKIYNEHFKDSAKTNLSLDQMYAKLPKELKYQADAPFEAVLQHIDYLVKKVGIEHVSIGSDFDGINSPPQQLDDVSKFPLLTKALLERGYSKDDIEKIMGLNFLRILKENEVH